MGKTAHQLHTTSSESPASIGVSASLNLSPRSLTVGGQTPTNTVKSGDYPGHAGTKQDTVCRGFVASETETAHQLHTAGASTAHEQSVTLLALDRKVTERLRLRLAQLEMLPGAISGKGLERSSAGVDRGLPVDDKGRAKGDVSVMAFRRRIAGAKSLRARLEILKELEAAIRDVKVSKRKGRPEYDLSVAEGCRNAGRLATTHGVRYACESLQVPRSTMYRYKADYERAARR